jgi:hypothetical protein
MYSAGTRHAAAREDGTGWQFPLWPPSSWPSYAGPPEPGWPEYRGTGGESWSSVGHCDDRPQRLKSKAGRLGRIDRARPSRYLSSSSRSPRCPSRRLTVRLRASALRRARTHRASGAPVPPGPGVPSSPAGAPGERHRGPALLRTSVRIRSAACSCSPACRSPKSVFATSQTS